MTGTPGQSETIRSFVGLRLRLGRRAPLSVIAHGWGSVIASRYLYDLEFNPAKRLIADPVQAVMGDSLLSRGRPYAWRDHERKGE